MPSRTLATLTILAAGILAPATAADAAAKKVSKYPTVKKIAPMTVSVGETMTLTGSGYVKGKGKNTVVFRRAGKRTIFAKADGLSSTRLSVIVPEKVRELLGKSSARLQIRVLAKRFGKTYTPLSKSPTVVLGGSEPAAPAPTTAAGAPASGTTSAPAPVAKSDSPPPPPPPPNCDGDNQVDSVDSDDDNDLLIDTKEATLETNRCLADTDGDGMTDGWEYQSAYDLNEPSCPAASGSDVYPIICSAVRPFAGRRNYPNPLWPDRESDYDGDWLPAGHEHTAWSRKAAANSAYRTLDGMWYSAGKQSSVNDSTSDGCVGMVVTPAMLLFGDPAFSPDRNRSRTSGDGCLSDDERDEDGDFLANHVELNGELSNPEWWTGNYKDEKAYRSVYEGTDWLDHDTDDDEIVDGIDDQDYDDFWNIEEISRGGSSYHPKAIQLTADDPATPNVDERTYGPGQTGYLKGLWVQPFNPCLPAVNSKTCSKYVPLGGEAWAPFLANEQVAPNLRWPLWGDVTRTAPSDAGDYYTGFWNSNSGDTDLPVPSAQRLPLRPHDSDPSNDLSPTVEHPIPLPE